jgi:diguanylate cyclase (GGDEF)-like protein
VLKIVSKIIYSRIRKTDMFARYGGEEFVFLMPDTALEPALTLNDKLRDVLSDAGFHYDNEKCIITASVGIATFCEGDSIEEVMKRADIALYESKDAGRNTCTIAQRDLRKMTYDA